MGLKQNPCYPRETLNSRIRKDRKERRLSLDEDPISMNRLEIADETADGGKLRRKRNSQAFEKKGVGRSQTLQRMKPTAALHIWMHRRLSNRIAAKIVTAAKQANFLIALCTSCTENSECGEACQMLKNLSNSSARALRLAPISTIPFVLVC